jgi:hypothetical protein
MLRRLHCSRHHDDRPLRALHQLLPRAGASARAQACPHGRRGGAAGGRCGCGAVGGIPAAGSVQSRRQRARSARVRVNAFARSLAHSSRSPRGNVQAEPGVRSSTAGGRVVLLLLFFFCFVLAAQRCYVPACRRNMLLCARAAQTRLLNLGAAQRW